MLFQKLFYFCLFLCATTGFAQGVLSVDTELKNKDSLFVKAVTPVFVSPVYTNQANDIGYCFYTKTEEHQYQRLNTTIFNPGDTFIFFNPHVLTFFNIASISGTVLVLSSELRAVLLWMKAISDQEALKTSVPVRSLPSFFAKDSINMTLFAMGAILGLGSIPLLIMKVNSFLKSLENTHIPIYFQGNLDSQIQALEAKIEKSNSIHNKANHFICPKVPLNLPN